MTAEDLAQKLSRRDEVADHAHERVEQRRAAREGVGGEVGETTARDEELNTAGDARLVVSVPIRLVIRDGVGGIDAAIKGCGIVRPFASTTREAVDKGELELLLPDWSSGRLDVFAVYPKSRTVPARVQAFV